MAEGRTAIVTGGSRGIGREVSLRLAALGYDIAIVYVGDENEAAETVRDCEANGIKAKAYVCDVSSFEETKDVVAQIRKDFENPVEALVNNAGIRRDNILALMPAEDWDKVLEIALGGFYNVTQPLLQPMMFHKWGRIITLASVSGLKGMPGQANYSAAKGGVIAATKALAQEVARKGVTVNAVAPGFIRTDMTDGLNEAELVKDIPARRFGTPEEVAALVGFLVSPEAGYITGEVISVNGGLYT